YSQSGGKRFSVLPHLARRCAFIKRLDDRRASSGLHGNHAWTLRSDPAQLFHFIERFPHADHSNSTARRVDDRVRQRPAHLLGHFVTHRLFALYAKRLFQGGHVEPALGLFAFTDHTSAIGNQTVNQGDLRAIAFTFHAIRHKNIFGHEEICFDVCRRRVGSEGAGRVPGRRRCNFLDAVMASHGYGSGHTSRLECARRVESFFFDENVRNLATRKQRREAFAERDRIYVRQNVAVAPHRFRFRSERFARYLAFERRKVVAHVKRSSTFRAQRLRAIGPKLLGAARTFKSNDLCHEPTLKT